jgi:hypothetical protein
MRRSTALSRFRLLLSWMMCAAMFALNTTVAVFALLLYAVTP